MNSTVNRDKMLEIVFMVIVALMSIAAIIPFILVLSSSLTDEMTIIREGYNLFPANFSLDAYKLIFKGKLIFDAYKVTIFVTVIGTLLSLIVTSGLAYGIICKSIKHRNKIAFFIYFTMLFNGGLVPMYLLISKYLHMKDTIWVLIVPALVNPWNLFLLKNFFSGIPESIIESARIDGANDIRILFRIILPISLPGLATIGLFYALTYWNEWFRALLFISDKELFPLQYLIVSILRTLDAIQSDANEAQLFANMVPAYTTRLATIMVTIGPIIFFYPFVQKYFVQGITVGAVKG